MYIIQTVQWTVETEISQVYKTTIVHQRVSFNLDQGEVEVRGVRNFWYGFHSNFEHGQLQIAFLTEFGTSPPSPIIFGHLWPTTFCYVNIYTDSIQCQNQR